MKKTGIICILIFLFNCSCGFSPRGKGQTFLPEMPTKGMAKVIHYRVGSVILGGIFYDLYMDGRIVTFIGNGGFFSQELVPGEYDYSVKEDVYAQMGFDISEYASMRAKVWNVLKVKLEADKTYYFKWNVTESYKVEEIDAKIALNELEGLKRFKFDADEYLSEIASAFSMVTYPGDENIVSDNCNNGKILLNEFKGKSPEQIKSAALHKYAFDFGCFTDEGRRYYISEFMREAVIYPYTTIAENLVFALSREDGWDPIGGYSSRQIEVIIEFLEDYQLHKAMNEFDPVYEAAIRQWNAKAQK